MSLELLEEIEVLKSIYGEGNILAENYDSYWSLTYIDLLLDIQLSLNILLEYPINNSETLKIQTLNSSSPISSSSIQEILLQISKNHPNETIIFQILECIKESCCGNEPSNIETIDETETIDFNTLQIIQDLQFDSPSNNNENDHIIHGLPFTEMKSTFQAHIAPVSSMDEVKAFRSKVLEDKKVARATHNIFSYRFTCPKTGIIYHDNDDDGETAAGGRLAEMMRLMGAEGVAVIVSRWFGGILLGPDRFKYICNVARDLLEENGFCEETKKSKRKK